MRSRIGVVIGVVGIVVTLVALWVTLSMLLIALTPPTVARAQLDDPTPIPRELFEPAVVAPTPAQSATIRHDPPKPASTPTPRPVVALRRSVTGTATWFCKPGVSRCTKGFAATGYYAAAGPALRAALGPDWRGRMVEVTNGARDQGVWVRLIDWCACGGDHVIDLYWAAFVALGGNGADAEVSW